MDWRGKDKKITNLKFNTITPVFHSELEIVTHLKCCCNAHLKVDSEYYVLRVQSKSNSKFIKDEFIYAGNSCGRQILELSNQINNTNYQSIPFFKINACNTIERITEHFGFRDFQQPNKPHSQYTKFNKEYLLAIFIICQVWNEPFPYGKFAEIVIKIHQEPEIDQHLHIPIFNNAIFKGKRTLIQSLESFRHNHKDAFPNQSFDLLHNYILSKGLKSNIK